MQRQQYCQLLQLWDCSNVQSAAVSANDGGDPSTTTTHNKNNKHGGKSKSAKSAKPSQSWWSKLWPWSDNTSTTSADTTAVAATVNSAAESVPVSSASASHSDSLATATAATVPTVTPSPSVLTVTLPLDLPLVHTLSRFCDAMLLAVPTLVPHSADSTATAAGSETATAPLLASLVSQVFFTPAVLASFLGTMWVDSLLWTLAESLQQQTPATASTAAAAAAATPGTRLGTTAAPLALAASASPTVGPLRMLYLRTQANAAASIRLGRIFSAPAVVAAFVARAAGWRTVGGRAFRRVFSIGALTESELDAYTGANTSNSTHMNPNTGAGSHSGGASGRMGVGTAITAFVGDIVAGLADIHLHSGRYLHGADGQLRFDANSNKDGLLNVNTNAALVKESHAQTHVPLLSLEQLQSQSLLRSQSQQQTQSRSLLVPLLQSPWLVASCLHIVLARLWPACVNTTTATTAATTSNNTNSHLSAGASTRAAAVFPWAACVVAIMLSALTVTPPASNGVSTSSVGNLSAALGDVNNSSSVFTPIVYKEARAAVLALVTHPLTLPYISHLSTYLSAANNKDNVNKQQQQRATTTLYTNNSTSPVSTANHNMHTHSTINNGAGSSAGVGVSVGNRVKMGFVNASPKVKQLFSRIAQMRKQQQQQKQQQLPPQAQLRSSSSSNASANVNQPQPQSHSQSHVPLLLFPPRPLLRVLLASAPTLLSLILSAVASAHSHPPAPAHALPQS